MIVASRPVAPLAAAARVHLLLGDTLERLGRHREAAREYEVAITAAGTDDPLRIASRAHDAMRRRL